MNERGLGAAVQQSGEIKETLDTIGANISSIFGRIESIKVSVGADQKVCAPTIQCQPESLAGYVEMVNQNVHEILTDLIEIDSAIRRQLGNMPLR